MSLSSPQYSYKLALSVYFYFSIGLKKWLFYVEIAICGFHRLAWTVSDVQSYKHWVFLAGDKDFGHPMSYACIKPYGIIVSIMS
jgi:hypothetical protein